LPQANVHENGTAAKLPKLVNTGPLLTNKQKKNEHNEHAEIMKVSNTAQRFILWLFNGSASAAEIQ
jgi:hypothetical protein